MTAPHQDSRVEAALTEGVKCVVGAVVEPLGEWFPPEVRALLRVVPPQVVADLEGRARSALLELLAAVGVDTSAHVHAPRAEVHVHRDPPHDTEARPREPLSFE